MNVIKILGIGSPFGDDQAGWKVAEALEKQLAIYANITPFVLIECHDRPGIGIFRFIQGFHTVYIIDAVKSGSEPGTIHQFKNKDILSIENRFSTHGFGVIEALHIASSLNELPVNIQFYGIEIDRIILDSTLSSCVKKAIAKLAIQLKNEIKNLLK